MTKYDPADPDSWGEPVSDHGPVEAAYLAAVAPLLTGVLPDADGVVRARWIPE